MTHYPNRLTRPSIFKGDDDVLLAGFAAQEVYGVVVFFGFVIIGRDKDGEVVVEAKDRLILFVA